MSKIKDLGNATLTYGDQSIELPVFEGTEKEKAVDIRALRKETGMNTYDPGFVNTGCCQSDITYIAVSYTHLTLTTIQL